MKKDKCKTDGECICNKTGNFTACDLDCWKEFATEQEIKDYEKEI